jgi:Family of unknown function (DUF6065)
MRVTAYVIDGHQMDIRPAPVERGWMDATGDRFAYRCLPLAIANAHGWEILCRGGFVARWSGGPELGALKIFGDPGSAPSAVSHFGHGILTFHIPCLFRTEPGVDLFAQGPINRPKDAIAPLSGIVETDWAPYTFTMNWQFTRPGVAVRFDAGEPICQVWPQQRGALEAVEPEVRLLSEAPELKRQYEAWNATRLSFNVELSQPGSGAQAQKWQKLYHQGLMQDGSEAAISDHRTRFRLKPFLGPGSGSVKPQ